MIIGEIRIDTTWAASTSFIPFPPGYHNAQNFEYEGVANRGIYATTAFISGVWERQLWDEGFYDEIVANPVKHAPNDIYGQGGVIPDPSGSSKILRGLSWVGQGDVGNAFQDGTVIEVKVRKLKALKSSPNRSGVQINRQLFQGNKLVFRYVAQGELTRPL